MTDDERLATDEVADKDATVKNVRDILDISDEVAASFQALEPQESPIDPVTLYEAPDQDKATMLTIAALTKAGLPANVVETVGDTSVPTDPVERQKKQAIFERQRVIAFFSFFTEKIAEKVFTQLDGSSDHDAAVEQLLEAEVDNATTGQNGVLKKASGVASYLRSFLPGAKTAETPTISSEKNFSNEYKSIMVELTRRLSYVKKRLKYLGGGEVGSELKIALSFTTLIPFALLGELRKKFELAHKTLWWLKRTSRIYVEDRHGGIGEKEPQDQSLRNEASSFPLAAEIPQTDVASILTKKLERFAKNKEEYFLNDGMANVLVWNKNKPMHLHIPLAWFVGPEAVPLSQAKQRVEALLEETLKNQDLGFTNSEVEWLKRQAYGNYSNHSESMKQVFNADIAIVLDGVDVHDPKAVMNHGTFLTAGARVRETLIFQHEGNDPLRGVNGVVNKFAHTHVDGKTARAMMIQDLEGTAELAQAETTQDLTGIDFSTMVSQLDATMIKTMQEERDLDEYTPETGAQREYYGVVQVSKERSQSWIQIIGHLREVYKKENPNNPVSFGTADLFCLAHMLAGRTQSVHFLESRSAKLPVQNKDGTESQKDVEVLDVAFNVIPEQYLQIFNEVMKRVYRGTFANPTEDMKNAWKDLPYTPKELADLREHLLEGMRQFLEEKVRAKNSNSMASFMSTLAGGIKQVEKLMQYVSETSLSVGQKMTQAVGNPRGGMVSMLAETRSIPTRQENGVNMLWFGSANTDIFMGSTAENWGGILGVSSNSEGFHFFLRKLLQQSRVSINYYAENKAFQDSLSSAYAKSARLKNVTLHTLPDVIREYEESSEKDLFFGSGYNHRLIIADLKAKQERFAQTEAHPEQDAQRQTEDVVYAMEFLLQLLASDPAAQAPLKS
jgi:hypothetical protein